MKKRENLETDRERNTKNKRRSSKQEDEPVELYPGVPLGSPQSEPDDNFKMNQASFKLRLDTGLTIFKYFVLATIVFESISLFSNLFAFLESVYPIAFIHLVNIILSSWN